MGEAAAGGSLIASGETPPTETPPTETPPTETPPTETPPAEVFAKIGDQTFADAAALKEAYPQMTMGEDGKMSIAAPASPDSYEFTAPEGHEIDSALVELATPIMKDAKLTQDQAQAMVSFSYKMREHDDSEFRKTVQAEGDALKAKLGEGYEPAKNRVNALITKFSPRAEELRALVVDQLGLGSKEVFVEFLDAVAKAFSTEDVSGLGDAGAGGEKLTEQQRLEKKYPKMFADKKE